MSTVVQQPNAPARGMTESELNAELAAARSGSVLAPLSHLGVLAFSGADTEAFLQGQLSCDVGGVGRVSGTLGAYCSPKGRTLASFVLWREESGFFMVLPRDLLDAVRKRISMFVLRSKVVIADASSTLTLIGCAGPLAEDALRPLFSRLPERARETAHHPENGVVMKLDEARFLLAVPSERAAAVQERLSQSLRPVGQRAWQWLDIRNGIPWITAATQEQFVPQMANLELLGGVSFSKGCYTGQEIVARTQHLGKLKRRMFLANVPGAAAPGDPLYSDDFGDQACGMVVNAEASPEGGCDLLAVIQIGSAENSIVRLKAPAGPALRLLTLPYAVA
ncbi:MAG: folate-binding protein YgfZ [Burkholderiales bacterium]